MLIENNNAHVIIFLCVISSVQEIMLSIQKGKKLSKNFEIKTFQIWGGSGDFSVSAWLRQECEKAR